MLLKVGGAWITRFSMMCTILVSGCMVQESDTKRQLSGARLIATPPSHYSTQKARYLGEKYQGKLDRLIEMIIANPKTSKLQFANNLGSSGGIGFFTHSAVKTPDERFLEVVLGTGENFEGGEYSLKVARLFSVYGRELLLILASDLDIYNERELSGYGLNFTWRTTGSRMSTERAIVYLPKEKVKAFLRQDIGENTLLAEAVIFVMEPEGQATLLSFRAPQEPVPDVRAPIQEQVLLPGQNESKASAKQVLAQRPLSGREGIKQPANGEESSAGEKKKKTPGSRGQTSPKETTLSGSLTAKEEIGPERMIDAIVGGKTESFGTASAEESESQSDNSIIPVPAVIETTQTDPPAVQSPQPQIERKAPEAKFQLEKKDGKTSELSSLVEVIKEKEQNEFGPNLAGSQPSDLEGESRPNEASKTDLTIHVASAETQQSFPKETKDGSEVDEPDYVASIPEIPPQPASTEKVVPAPITPSELQNDKTDSGEQRPALAYEKRLEKWGEIKSPMIPMPKALEGYIIQVPFKDRSEARSWADYFERRGYAVSMTETGGGESLRVRIGNFRLRGDAERQLESIREGGLVGIILNLPQAYRGEVRSSQP